MLDPLTTIQYPDVSDFLDEWKLQNCTRTLGSEGEVTGAPTHDEKASWTFPCS